MEAVIRPELVCRRRACRPIARSGETRIAVVDGQAAWRWRGRRSGRRDPVVHQCGYAAIEHVLVAIPADSGNGTGAGVLPEVPCAPFIAARASAPGIACA